MPHRVAGRFPYQSSYQLQFLQPHSVRQKLPKGRRSEHILVAIQESCPNLNVRREFVTKLPARSTHANPLWRQYNHRFPMQFASQDRLGCRDSLGAQSHRIRRVLDVAPTIDDSRFRSNRTTHGKVTIGIVRLSRC